MDDLIVYPPNRPRLSPAFRQEAYHLFVEDTERGRITGGCNSDCSRRSKDGLVFVAEVMDRVEKWFEGSQQREATNG